MNRISAIALLVAASFITAGNASAQNTVKADVPFSFTVGTSTMPAGTYMIKSELPARNLIYLTNPDKKETSMALAIPEEGTTRTANKLVFHKYGDRYFLSEVHCTGASVNVEFPVTKAEKWARRQIETAGQRVDDGVLIALK